MAGLVTTGPLSFSEQFCGVALSLRRSVIPINCGRHPAHYAEGVYYPRRTRPSFCSIQQDSHLDPCFDVGAISSRLHLRLSCGILYPFDDRFPPQSQSSLLATPIHFSSTSAGGRYVLSTPYPLILAEREKVLRSYCIRTSPAMSTSMTHIAALHGPDSGPCLRNHRRRNWMLPPRRPVPTCPIPRPPGSILYRENDHHIASEPGALIERDTLPYGENDVEEIVSPLSAVGRSIPSQWIFAVETELSGLFSTSLGSAGSTLLQLRHKDMGTYRDRVKRRESSTKECWPFWCVSMEEAYCQYVVGVVFSPPSESVIDLVTRRHARVRQGTTCLSAKGRRGCAEIPSWTSGRGGCIGTSPR
jgi:hypothetical protein